MTDTRRAEMYDVLVDRQIEEASRAAPSTNQKKLLKDLTGTLRYALGQDNPTAAGEGLQYFKAKLTANRRGVKELTLGFAKRKWFRAGRR